MDLRFSIAGLVVGTFVGISGVGGSSILAPILILLLGVKPSIAVGTDLAYSVPTKLLAFYLHARRKNVDWRVTWLLFAGGLPGALAGLALFFRLRGHGNPIALETTLRHAIGFSILLACVGAAVTWLLRARLLKGSAPAPALDDNGRPRPPVPAVIVGIGALVGFLVSFTSIGSGSITLPLLVLALPMFGLRRLIGSEIAYAALLVPVAAAGHASLGGVGWPMVAALLVGSLPGVWIGSQLSALVGEGWLRPVIVGVLAFAGSRLV